MRLELFDAAAVAERLDYPGCTRAVREAMIALSAGRTRQLLRTMIAMGERGVFAQMPGALGTDDMFGAKLISVFDDPARPGRRRHRGLVVMFSEDGDPVCVADAEQVTLIRTAAMTAAATDALARPDADLLALFGCGAQAISHAHALAPVRAWREVRIWGRDAERAAACATRIVAETGLPARAITDAHAAARGAGVICTLTHASEPILLSRWLSPGSHVNLVGSSGPGPVEVDQELVVAARFIADSRASIIGQGAEFLRAKEAGAIDDTHIAAEIGEVFAGTASGRTSPDQLTVFKSIGHAVQDLAAAAYLYRGAEAAR